MNIKKIITHAGQFHADEVMAIAIILWCYPSVEVERKFNVTEEEFNNLEIWILDIGRRYDKELKNFDHHQNPELEATNVLIALELRHLIAVNIGLPEKSNIIFKMLCTQGLNDISNRDRGLITDNAFSFNTIIRNMNSLHESIAFNKAMNLAKTVFEAMLLNVRLAIETEEKWNNLSKVNEFTKLQETSEVLIGWKELAEKEDIFMLITPNERGGWQIVSRDTTKLVLPEFANQTFRHNSGFLVVFATKEEAIEAANKVITLDKEKQIKP